MKYLKKINPTPMTFIALVVVQAYGPHQFEKKYRKSWAPFKNKPRAAADCALGTRGKLNGRTITAQESRQFALMMSWSSPNVMLACEWEATGLSALSVIWDDTCLRTHHDPIVEEWRLEKKGEKRRGKWGQV